MEKLNKVAKLTEEYLKNYCSNLETKRENNKYLFFCGNYLIGSTVLIDEEKIATTVYSAKMNDQILKNFLNKIKGELGNDVLEQGIRTSGALNENFYYAYNWIKL
ncbi:MAG: hypothetical protein DSY42_02705 [Aquifex sp.]|nr:MAG: hypothetical protein DSY42_02705 [Aquifex sp.]